MSETTGCRKCGRPMPAGRLEFGYEDCAACTPQGKPRGVMVYEHKTGGWCEPVNEDVFREMKTGNDGMVESL